MLKTHLITIENDLKKHHRPKEQLFDYYIQFRLTKSLNTYYKDLTQSVSYLMKRNSNNILRKM